MFTETTQYLASHGKAPRGHGNWFFEMTAPGHGSRNELYGYGGFYSDARKAAERHAKAEGWTRVQLMP